MENTANQAQYNRMMTDPDGSEWTRASGEPRTVHGVTGVSTLCGRVLITGLLVRAQAMRHDRRLSFLVESEDWQAWIDGSPEWRAKHGLLRNPACYHSRIDVEWDTAKKRWTPISA